MSDEFWKNKSLENMNEAEWEMLCDHCGRCCLFKLEDADTKEIFYTNVACQLLDPITCECISYHERDQIIHSCILLSPDLARELHWLPDSCAYKQLAQNKSLDWWHPLISKDKNTIIAAGISVSGKTISEKTIDISKLETHIIDWIEHNSNSCKEK